MCADLIIAEIHRAISALGGADRPRTQEAAAAALRELGADVDLRSLVDSWQDTLDDEEILELLKNWNAGLPLFQSVIASRPEDE